MLGIMLGTILMFTSIIYCLYLGQYSNLETYQTLWKDVALMWMPLVAAGWTYYFKTKSDQATAERIKNQ